MGDENITILLVEDNPGHAELVKRGLAAHRLENSVVHVGDGEAALDMLHNRSPFDDPDDYPRPGIHFWGQLSYEF